jgi:hypothetical protein
MPGRDAGGSFTLNNPDDGTGIKKMFALGDGLLMITEKCCYRIQIADQIDPGRTNPALPTNVQQKLFDHGTNSQLLCRTLLQAKVLFRREFQTADIDRAMQRSFDALGDLISMDETASAFKNVEQAEIERVQTLKRKDASLTLPAIGSVRSHAKSFMQKADHFVGSIMEIVRLFYPEMKSKNWENFHSLTKVRYGQDDNFYKTMDLFTPLLLLARNTRDCLEHGNLTGVSITDFELKADGSIAKPSIEINFRKSKHDRCGLSWFMEQTIKALLDAFELVIVHLCDKNIQPFAGIPMTIALLSEDYRQAWHVNFAYGTYFQDGQFSPCG